jgi:hypothetical protein
MTELDPVMVGEPLWTLQTVNPPRLAFARFLITGWSCASRIDGELYYSHRFTAWEPLEQAAREKKADFEERGWK